jgi:hypothetical protein
MTGYLRLRHVAKSYDGKRLRQDDNAVDDRRVRDAVARRH